MAISKDVLSTSSAFQDFARGYFTRLDTLLKAIDLESLDQLLQGFLTARDKDRTVFIVGNGGSAATASHMANDFALGVLKGLAPAKPFRVLSLTDNVPLLTAIGNDLGYDQIFRAQLEALFRKDDVLLAISASGNSPNVIEAAKWVKANGGTVMSLTGFDGGALKEMSDICVHIATPRGEFGPVEDLHMIIDHVLHSWLRSQAQKISRSAASKVGAKAESRL